MINWQGIIGAPGDVGYPGKPGEDGNDGIKGEQGEPVSNRHVSSILYCLFEYKISLITQKKKKNWWQQF